MKTFRVIFALITCLAFAGRAPAQLTLLDLDSTLNMMMVGDAHQVDDSDCCCCCCCCDDEEVSDDSSDDLADDESSGDCCGEDGCDSAHCPVCMDHPLPASIDAYNFFQNDNVPLILEVRHPLGDGWQIGLERPPRAA